MSKPKRSDFVEDILDLLEGTKRRKVERREREVERATERLEITLHNGRKVEV